MKKVFLLLLFLAPYLCQGQDTTTVSFSLDTLSIDSFFLQVETSRKPQGQARATTLTEPVFFSDTMAFNLYINALAQRLTNLESQKAQIGIEYNEVTSQVTALTNLRDSVFRGETGFSRSALAPPAEAQFLQARAQPSTGTTWVVFGATPEQAIIYDPGVQLETDAIILKPNGDVVQFKRQKKKKPK